LSFARELGAPMPVTAAVREVLQSHFGAAEPDAAPNACLQKDFAALLGTMALLAGMKHESENIAVSDGLQSEKEPPRPVGGPRRKQQARGLSR
jgi:3-hydroxyisobutyrate dehydrogenase